MALTVRSEVKPENPKATIKKLEDGGIGLSDAKGRSDDKSMRLKNSEKGNSENSKVKGRIGTGNSTLKRNKGYSA